MRRFSHDELKSLAAWCGCAAVLAFVAISFNMASPSPAIVAGVNQAPQTLSAATALGDAQGIAPSPSYCNTDWVPSGLCLNSTSRALVFSVSADGNGETATADCNAAGGTGRQGGPRGNSCVPGITAGAAPTIALGQSVTVEVDWMIVQNVGFPNGCNWFCGDKHDHYDYRMLESGCTLSVNGSDENLPATSYDGGHHGAGSVTFSPTTDTTYSVSCSGTMGSVSLSIPVTVTVTAPSSCGNGLDYATYGPSCSCPSGQVQAGNSCTTPGGPVLSLVASPTATIYGRSVTVSWSATGGTGFDACYLGGGQWGSGVAVGTSGASGTDGLTGVTNYWYQCHDPYFGWQTAQASASVVCINNLDISQYPSCSCPSGEIQSGTSCVVPAPATCPNGLDYATYGPSCVCTGGQIQSGNVCITPGAPTLSIWASPPSTLQGNPTTVQWKASGNLDACYLSGGQWPGGTPVGLDGAALTQPLDVTTTYYYQCHDVYYGWQTESTTVTITGLPAGIVNISASPQSVPYNSPSTISWTSQNVTSCLTSGPGITSNAPNSSQGTGQLTGNATYTINCTGTDGKPYSDTTTVTVGSAPPPPSINTSAPQVLQGGDSTISWQCGPGATSSFGTFNTGGATAGSAVVSPTNTTNYVVTCVYPVGNTSASITITVKQPQLSIVADPTRVRKGLTTKLTWAALNVTPSSCKVSDSNGQISTGDSGTLSPIVNSAEAFTLQCKVPTGTVSATANVLLIPEFIEK
jgi:hypothetical protein